MPAAFRQVYQIEIAQAKRNLRELRSENKAVFQEFEAGGKRITTSAASAGKAISTSLGKSAFIGADQFTRQAERLRADMNQLREAGIKSGPAFDALRIKFASLGAAAQASGVRMSGSFLSSMEAGQRTAARLAQEHAAVAAQLKREAEAAKQAETATKALTRAHAAALAEQSRRVARMNTLHGQALAENARRDAAPERRRMFIAELGSSISASGVPGGAALGNIASAAGPIAAVTAAVVALGLALGTVSSASISFESAFANVRKTVGGTLVELEPMRQGILQMSLDIPKSANELAGLAAIAGQFGVRKEDILGFTRTIADLGVAVDGISAEEAAASLAQIGNITGASTGEIQRMASVLVELGNNGASTESQILELAKRIAAAGTQAGLSQAEIFGFAGAMANLGIEAESGGTAFSRTIRDMDAAVARGGKELAKFAEAAGTTSEKFAAAFREKPAKAMQMFLDSLGRAKEEGRNVTVVLDALGVESERQADVLGRFAKNTGGVAEQLRMANEEFARNTALQNEAAAKYETTASQIELLKNSLQKVKIEIGDQLLPVTKELVIGFRDFVNSGAGDAFARFAVEAAKLAKALYEIFPPFLAIRVAAEAFSAVFGHTFGEVFTAAVDTAATVMQTFRILIEQAFLVLQRAAIDFGIAFAEDIFGPLVNKAKEMAPLFTKLGKLPVPGANLFGAVGGVASALDAKLSPAIERADARSKDLSRRINLLGDELNKNRDAHYDVGRSAEVAERALNKAAEETKKHAAASAAATEATKKYREEIQGLAESFLKASGFISASDFAKQNEAFSLALQALNAAGVKSGPVLAELQNKMLELAKAAKESSLNIAGSATGSLASSLEKVAAMAKALGPIDIGRTFAADMGIPSSMTGASGVGDENRERVRQMLGLPTKQELDELKADLPLALKQIFALPAEMQGEALDRLRPQLEAYKQHVTDIDPLVQRAFDASKVDEFGNAISGLFSQLAGGGGIKGILGGLGKDLLGGLLGGGKGMKGTALGGLFSSEGPLGGIMKSLGGTGLGKSLGGIFGGPGFSANLGAKLGGLFGGSGKAGVGAMSGIFTAGIGTAISMAAPMVLGGLKKLFGGTPEWKKVAKDAGKAYGMDITDEMAKAIRERQKTLGVSRSLGVALALPEMAEQATIGAGNLGKFTAQFDTLLKAAQAGGKGAAEALTAAGQGFDVLVRKAQEAGASGTAAFGQLIASARAAGLESYKVFAGQQAAAGAGFLGTMFQSANVGAGDLGRLGAMSESMLASMQGMPGARAMIESLSPALDAIAEKAKKAGQALPAGIAGLIGERNFAKDHADLFAMNEALTGFTKNMGEAGLIQAPAFAAIQGQIAAVRDQFVAAGKSQEESLALVAPSLQEVANNYARWGGEIDPVTRGMLDQAAAAGLVKLEGTGLVNVLERGLNRVIELLGGDPIFGTLSNQAQNAVNQTQASIASLGSSAMSQAEAVAGGVAGIATSVANAAGGAAASALDIIRQVRAEGGSAREALQEYYQRRHEGRGGPEPETHAGGGPVYGRGVAGDGEYVVSRKGRAATGDALLDAANAGMLRGGGGGIVLNINLYGGATQADADLLERTVADGIRSGRIPIPAHRIVQRGAR